jgi:hypothetical protein
MTEVVYNLENFDTSLDGSRIVFFASAAAASLPAQLNDIICSPAISSRVLISSAKSDIPLLFKGAWNAVFTPLNDWQLVLTYCSYMPKPAIIVIEDGVAVPDAFISRLQPQKNLQIVCLRALGLTTQVPAWADAVFLPFIADLTGADADAVLSHLGGLCGSSISAEHKKAWLREVRVAKAALVWTRIQERGPAGAVYWYDPADGSAAAAALPARAIRKYMNALIDLIA